MTSGGIGAMRALLRDYRAFAGWKLGGALLLMAAGAVAEGVGVLMIVPLATIAASPDHIPQGLHQVLAPFETLPPNQRLEVALGLFLLAIAARSLLIYARAMCCWPSSRLVTRNR